MFEVVETLQSPADESLNVWFEPWAEGVTLPPGTTVELRATAPKVGRLEIEHQQNGAVVYGWPGSTLQVFAGGEVAWSSCSPCPELPAGMDLREFTSFMFGPPPTQSAVAGETAVKRPWWKFWGQGHTE